MGWSPQRFSRRVACTHRGNTKSFFVSESELAAEGSSGRYIDREHEYRCFFCVPSGLVLVLLAHGLAVPSTVIPSVLCLQQENDRDCCAPSCLLDGGGRAGIIAGGLLILVRDQQFARLISVENSGIHLRKICRTI